ncbi:unnamed protein product [Mycena citricolor]|uniref:Rho guanyl-nucleotide exchange factor n=1 Tax=Mycena citricolor TaxID=2018698 RepID=A0AAD2HZT0_9AGAR|nr:unnamed protein product [Mycena citricolor]
MTLTNNRRPYQSRREMKRLKYSEKPCPRFSTTGSCARGLTCAYAHDPAKIAVCWNFLQGTCPKTAETCDLSHDPTPERTPLCVHFSTKVAALEMRARSHMSTLQHVRECPDFAEHGTCTKKGCKLPHVIRANRNRKPQISANSNAKSATALAPLVSSSGAPKADSSVATVTVEDAQLGDEFISLTFNESESETGDDDSEDGESSEDDESDSDELTQDTRDEMDRPLGPRQQPPGERSTAYEDIFGRRAANHHSQQPPYPPNQAQYQPYPPQQQYYPSQGYPQYTQQPQYRPQAPYPPSYPQLQTPYQYVRAPAGPRAPSLHSSVSHPPFQQNHPGHGVLVPPPTQMRDEQGLTPAQAYQAQVAYGRTSPAPPQAGMSRGSFLPPPKSNGIAANGGLGASGSSLDLGDRTSKPPSLTVAIGEGLGFNLNFDDFGANSAQNERVNSSGAGGVVDDSAPGSFDDDEESELPWARERDSPSSTKREHLSSLLFLHPPIHRNSREYNSPRRMDLSGIHRSKHIGSRLRPTHLLPPFAPPSRLHRHRRPRSNMSHSLPQGTMHLPIIREPHWRPVVQGTIRRPTDASLKVREPTEAFWSTERPGSSRPSDEHVCSVLKLNATLPGILVDSRPGWSDTYKFVVIDCRTPETTERCTDSVPCLLSLVADAFRQRVPLGDRVKDELTYHDAFDGREAVDRIAHIIKTTDRNLALLLGRALDAQKFFHDVTYDHRLRDSASELYQFQTKLSSPFASGEMTIKGSEVGENLLGPPSDVVSPDSFDDAIGLVDKQDDAPLPTGVFTLLADCYSPTCSRDQLCYSIACPRRLEQQARLNMKPEPGLKNSKETIAETLNEPDGDSGLLWIHSVPAEILASIGDTERKRQEAINEVIYTERDFVRDMEYLRDTWVSRIAAADFIEPAERKEQFLIQVFWNAHDIITVNGKLRDALNKRQRGYVVVDKIGDIFMDAVPHFEPFVMYGAHQLYGKYEFEKEKGQNPAFAAFVEATERLPESRKLELNAYLTKPTTRLARYPLLLEAVLKHTPADSTDKQTLPLVIEKIRALLSRVNEESGKAENRFNLAQLDSQLQFKQGDQVDLRLREEGRELVYKGPLNKRDGELQVYLFDHALLFVKIVKQKQTEHMRVYRKPIPLELLLVSASEDMNGKDKDTLRGQRRQLVRKSSFGNGAGQRGSPHPPSVVIRADAKGPNWISFSHLGRKAYSLVLSAGTPLAQRKWMENIIKQQTAMRERSLVFDTIALSEGFFGANKVNCAAPFSGGRRIVYGTDDGVYISDLRELHKDPVKVLALLDVSQVDVLEDYQLLIVLSERLVMTFPLEALDANDPTAGLKRAKRIATHTSFFKAGYCLGRVIVCVVKSTQLSSTFKALEPIEQNVRGRAKPTFKKLLQGGNDTLRPFKEFYIPVESTSIHYLKTRMCIGCSKGFEIVDLETLETQGLLDPSDESLEFVRKKENLRPMAIYRVNNDFLLCYDEFAFYVNRTGRRSRKNFIVYWEGTPTGFALHEPYVLAFEPSFVEIRHIDTGLMSQVIQGSNLRLLFADTPPSVNNGTGYAYNQGGYDRSPQFNPYAPPQYQYQQQQQQRYPQGVGRDEILMVSDDRVLALRTAEGPQRFMSDNVSMMSMPR